MVASFEKQSQLLSSSQPNMSFAPNLLQLMVKKPEFYKTIIQMYKKKEKDIRSSVVTLESWKYVSAFFVECDQSFSDFYRVLQTGQIYYLQLQQFTDELTLSLSQLCPQLPFATVIDQWRLKAHLILSYEVDLVRFCEEFGSVFPAQASLCQETIQTLLKDSDQRQKQVKVADWVDQMELKEYISWFNPARNSCMFQFIIKKMTRDQWQPSKDECTFSQIVISFIRELKKSWQEVVTGFDLQSIKMGEAENFLKGLEAVLEPIKEPPKGSDQQSYWIEQNIQRNKSREMMFKDEIDRWIPLCAVQIQNSEAKLLQSLLSVHRSMNTRVNGKLLNDLKDVLLEESILMNIKYILFFYFYLFMI